MSCQKATIYIHFSFCINFLNFFVIYIENTKIEKNECDLEKKFN